MRRLYEEEAVSTSGDRQQQYASVSKITATATATATAATATAATAATTPTTGATMTAKYWVAKYVEDPFRREARNVGVIVAADGGVVARFMGEREDGVFDERRTRNKFLYPNVYSQWREFWRAKIGQRDLDAITKAATANFYVEEGGEVGETGADNRGDVCQFLYTLLVSSGPKEAFEWGDVEDSEVALAQDITTAFREIEVLASGSQLMRRHPVVPNRSVPGQHVSHTPSFSQQNGQLYVFEYIDLSTTKINKAKERAGWMAYMFDDIKGFNPTAETFSLVRPEKDSGVEQIDYAKTILRGGSKIVNWSDDNERGQFLQEREQIAA